ncbi:MAG: hypothetical protein JSR73_15755 [Proteobacteria bacterium]|nr:hypothetical protein [Pseudomonadota bacterium]
MTTLRAPRPAAASRPPPRLVREPVELFVVTDDEELAAALREAAPITTVSVAATPGALADLLMVGRRAALVLDLATLGPAAATVARHLATQFPELPLVAVGSRDDEARLASLISTGQVYRFLHRPLSAARVRTFVDAALRRAAELVPATRPPSPSHGRGGSPARLLAALGAALLLAFGAWWLLHAGRSRTPEPERPPSQSASIAEAAPGGDPAASTAVEAVAAPPAARPPLKVPTSAPPDLAPQPTDSTARDGEPGSHPGLVPGPATPPTDAAADPAPAAASLSTPATIPAEVPAEVPAAVPATHSLPASDPTGASPNDGPVPEAATAPAAAAAPGAASPEPAPEAGAAAGGTAPTTVADAAPRAGADEPRP